MKKNTAIMTGLFILLILIFTINPMFFHHLQDTILGKLTIIATLIYLTMNSVTLGLLFTLMLIILSNRFDNDGLIEGIKNRKRTPGQRAARNAARNAARAAKREARKAAKVAKAQAKAAQAQAQAKAAEAEAVAQEAGDITLDDTNFAEAEDIGVGDITENFENGIDRLSIEETLRVKNPSTIPTNKEQFSIMGNILPFDNTMQLFGGMSSFV